MNVGELIEQLQTLDPSLPVYSITNGFSGYAEDAAVVGVTTFRVAEYTDPGVIRDRHAVGTEYAELVMEDL